MTIEPDPREVNATIFELVKGCGSGTPPELTIGDQIYNHGDMANPAHLATVTEVIPTSFGKAYRVKANDCERSEYVVQDHHFSPEFHGHSGTRIVTEAAYRAWQKTLLAELETAAARYRARH